VSLAGIVVLAPLVVDEERRTDILAWANEAGVVLMCRADEP
jgi:hypothetical protein